MNIVRSVFRGPMRGGRPVTSDDRAGIGPTLASTPSSSILRWSAVTLVALLVAGCSLTGPPVPVAPPVPPRAAEPVCEPCVVLKAQIARQQHELAAREAELSDLRAQRGEQARALEDFARQTARAQSRPRRLATRVTAASYIAEVEVALTGARAMRISDAAQARLAQAQELLDSSKEPFAQEDYDGAIESASRAADLIAGALEVAARPVPPLRPVPVAYFASPTPMRVKGDSFLRDGPSPKAAVRGVLKGGTTAMGHARRGDWIRVASADGRSGWVYGPLLMPR